MKKALIITIVIVLLCLSGLSAIFSATATTGNSSFVKNQTIACMVGFIVYFGISQTSPHTIKKSAIPVRSKNAPKIINITMYFEQTLMGVERIPSFE